MVNAYKNYFVLRVE